MPRGRRVNSNGEKSKQLLQEKAIELFSSKGFYKTKISDIVQAANVTQPTFYLYFKSKDMIYESLINRFKEEFITAVDEIKIHSEKWDFNTFISRFLTHIFDYYSKMAGLTKIAYDHKETADFINDYLKPVLIEKIEHVELGVDKLVFIESLLGAMERVTLTMLLTKKFTSEQLSNELRKISISQYENVF